jgi:hypothetical protein
MTLGEVREALASGAPRADILAALADQEVRPAPSRGGVDRLPSADVDEPAWLADASPAMRAGWQRGREIAAQHPLTEEQLWRVRTLLAGAHPAPTRRPA